MNIPIHAPIARPRFLPVEPLQAEADLAPFLGPDLAAACAAAVAAGDPLFICTAAGPLPRRLEAVTAWRKRTVGALLAACPPLADYFRAAPPDVQAAIRDGQKPLAEIEAAVAGWREETEGKRSAARLLSKNRLRAALVAALRDADGSEPGPVVPSFLAILESGEVGLFRRRGACIRWARDSGRRFFIGGLDPQHSKIHPNEAV